MKSKKERRHHKQHQLNGANGEVEKNMPCFFQDNRADMYYCAVKEQRYKEEHLRYDNVVKKNARSPANIPRPKNNSGGTVRIHSAILIAFLS